MQDPCLCCSAWAPDRRSPVQRSYCCGSQGYLMMWCFDPRAQETLFAVRRWTWTVSHDEIPAFPRSGQPRGSWGITCLWLTR
ncbi:hypothetical protein VTN02DRAFT_1567 [Thermoascus thermophilus]